MTPPLGALRQTAGAAGHRPDIHLVRTGRDTYVPTALQPREKYGEFPANANKGLEDPKRRAALAKSIARGYANHLGLSVPVSSKAAAQTQEKAPAKAPGPPPVDVKKRIPARDAVILANLEQMVADKPGRPVVSKIYADASVVQKAKLIGASTEAVTAKSQKTGEYLNPAPGKPNQFVTEEGKLQLQAWGHIRESRIQQPPSGYKGADRQPLLYSKSKNWTFTDEAKLRNGSTAYVTPKDAKRLEAWDRESAF